MSESPLDPPLNPVEQRVLGSLMEKQRTVPATYPLSLNALRTACNQASSRDPVVDYDDETLESALRELRQRELVRVVWADRGRRTLKYHQRLDEHLALQPDERALVTVLLLQGQQAPGELRTRTERLHTFADREAVEACLRRMAALPTPLVKELPRRPGQQDHRWVHLLGPGLDVTAPVAAAPPVDRESVLAEGTAVRNAKVVATYDEVAATYADQLVRELDHKPFDAWLLDRIPALAGDGPIADVGCGPGHISDRLAAAGAEVVGFDLSPGMLAEAGRRFPHLDVQLGNFFQLLRPTSAPDWAGVVAWYSLVHLAASELPAAIAALARVLRPGGVLLVGLHAGSEVRHWTQWWDHAIDIDFVLHDPDQVRAAVTAAGLVIDEWYLRGPLDGVEVETERLYVLARKPR